MKQVVLILSVFVLFTPIIVAAQDDPFSESYVGDGIRFSYPRGWFVETNEEGNATFQNMEFDTSQLGAEIPTGAIEIQVSAFVLENSDTEVVNLSSDKPEYALGYISGLFSVIDLFAISFAGEEATQLDVGIPTQIDIGSFNAIYSISSITNDRFLMLLFQDGEFAATVTARTPGDEMEQWLDLILAIAETIELSDEFVAPQPAGGDEAENGDGGDGVTSESMTVAFEALLNGDTQAAQDLSCEEDHAGIEASAGGLTALTEAAGEDVEVGVSCNVEGDAGTCDLDVGGVVTTFEFAVVDGLVCGGLTPVE